MASPPIIKLPYSISYKSLTFSPFFHYPKQPCTVSWSCFSVSCCYSTKKIKKNVSEQIGVKKDESLLFLDKGYSSFDDLGKPHKRKGLNLSLKLLLGKRAFWRKILSKKVRSILLLNVITIVYASNIPVVKEVETIIDPGAFTVVRFSLAAITFLPFLLQSRDDHEIRKAGIELGFWVSLGYIMQALGLLTSDAGRASFLTMFTVLVVPFLDGLLGSIIPARTWFGAFMSIVGVALLESSGSPPCVGDLLNFLSAVFFGVHMLRTEHISRRTDKESFLALLGYEVCVVAFLSATWYLVGGNFFGFHDLHASSWTWTTFRDSVVKFPWVPALYTGIFSTGLCLYAEMDAMRNVSATETAIVYGMEPLWGAGFAWFLLGERWGPTGWIGAGFILVGSLTVQIHGAISTSASIDNSPSALKGDDLLVSDKQDVLTKAPIVKFCRQPCHCSCTDAYYRIHLITFTTVKQRV
ncbi:hypothetical protein LIER_38772 [Lithospermum erythrorhizon]|uniref:EamA domain-containing protein n=1 Tax=Lithospermum erythrorhizon TaxID=34254 RepID=A0AAV3Q4I8_LITER